MNATPGLDPPVEAELQRFRRLAELFDNAFKIPGTSWRFGIDSLLGLVPGLGDVAGAAFTVYGIWLARRIGAPWAIQGRMLANIAIDALAGTVPVIGDLFDVAFKAHVRNRKLLEQWLGTPHVAVRQSRTSLLLLPAIALLLFAAILGVSIWVFVAFFRWLVSAAG
jgi:hypothetical protein